MIGLRLCFDRISPAIEKRVTVRQKILGSVHSNQDLSGIDTPSGVPFEHKITKHSSNSMTDIDIVWVSVTFP